MRALRTEQREYQRLLVHYRQTRTRADLGLAQWQRPRRGGPRPSGLRQVDLDEALMMATGGGGSGVYQKLETGRFRPTRELFQQVAKLLRFSPEHYRIAHLDLFGTEPVLPAAPPSPYWSQVICGQVEMACALAASGQMLSCNGSFQSMFPSGEAPSNFWRWALFSEEAREGVLIDWENAWAPCLTTEVVLARLRYPEDPAIAETHALLQRDARLSPCVAPSGAGLHGQARPLLHASKGAGSAHIMQVHASDSDITLLTIFFEKRAASAPVSSRPASSMIPHVTGATRSAA